MLAHQTAYRSAGVLFWVAAVMRAWARRVRAAGKRLDAWLEERQVAATPLRDLARMSEHELFDIGLHRDGLYPVVWGSSNRNPDHRV